MGMSETSDNEKQSGGISPNLKIIAALIIGLLLGAWANDEFDKPKAKYDYIPSQTSVLLWKADRSTGEAWYTGIGTGWKKADEPLY